MKKFVSLLTAVLFAFCSSASASSDTYIDYQNYNHGYCPSCNNAPCNCNQSPEGYPPQGYPQQGSSQQPDYAYPVPRNPMEWGDTPPLYPPPCGAPTQCPATAPFLPTPPCDPCAPLCGTDCGVSVCAIAVAILAVAVAAVIIVTASSGSSSNHTP